MNDTDTETVSPTSEAGPQGQFGRGLDSDLLWVLLVVSIPIFDVLRNYSKYLFSHYAVTGNAQNVWWPLAENVLSGGTLYVSYVDNKPPVFQFMNLAAGAVSGLQFDVYVLVFWLLVAFSNALAGLLVWQLLSREGHAEAGLLAALMYVAFASLGQGQEIDPRPFAAVFVVAAFLVRDKYASGASIATAGLLSQFSVLVIPPLLWYQINRGNSTWRRYGPAFCAAGLAAVAASFALVGLLWEPEAAVAGFEASYLDSGQYVAGYAEDGITAANDPLGWIYGELFAQRLFLFWYLLGGVAVWAWFRGPNQFDAPIIPAAAASALLLVAPKMIRPAVNYLFPPFLFLALLGGLGVAFLFHSSTGTDPWVSSAD